MEKRMPKWLEIILAIVTSIAVFWGATALASRAHDSNFLAQSRIFRMLMEEDSLDILTMIKSENKRKAAEKFTAAVTNAYVSFEMIPYDQGKTFNLIMNSLTDGIEIELFEFHGKDLLILGNAEGKSDYDSLVLGLSSSEIFERVEETEVIETDGKIVFSIMAFANTTPTQQGLFQKEEIDE